jgi:hypothetical protein
VEVHRRIVGLSLLKKRVSYYSKRPDKFVLKHKSKSTGLQNKFPKKHQFGLDYQQLLQTKSKAQKVWANVDDFNLLSGIIKHGFGEWETIVDDVRVWESHTSSTPLTDVQRSNSNWKELFEKIEGIPAQDLKDETVARK